MTDSPQDVPLVETTPGQRAAVFEDRQWLRQILLLAADSATVEIQTADGEETGMIVLSGTHDLEANAGSWISRGIRTSPFEGRPVALFLPPKTRFRASNGQGDLLLVSTLRPELPTATPVEPQQKPLLPLAGSNQAYDSASGSWKPIESFPESAEAILPRRIEHDEIGGVSVERVFPVDYKTLGLSIGEAVVPADAAVTVPTWIDDRAAAGYPEEWAVYYRAEAELEVGGECVSGDGVLCGTGEVQLRARGGRAYVALVCAGPKPPQE